MQTGLLSGIMEPFRAANGRFTKEENRSMQPKEMISAVERRKRFLINCAYTLTITAIVLLVIRYALSALMPFVIAAIVAAILRPVLRLLHEKLHLPRKFAGVLLTVLFYVLLATLGAVLFGRAITTITGYLSSLPALWSNTLMPALRSLLDLVTAKLTQLNIRPDFSVDELLTPLGSAITSVSSSLVGMAGNVAFSLPSMIINVIICIVSTLFILFDWDRMVDFLFLQISSKKGELIRTMSRQFVTTIRQFIVSYGLIMLVTFTELSIGFLLIGFRNPFLLAALISVFDILPVVGCGGILIPWTLISFIIGNTGNGIGLALLYIAITIIRNIAEPKIVGKQVGLHPLVTLLSMVIGSSLMGGVGLFGLPITLAVLNKMNQDGLLHLYKTESEPRPEPETPAELQKEKKAG